MVLKCGYWLISATNPKFVTVTILKNNMKLTQRSFALHPFNPESNDDIETQFALVFGAYWCHKTEICDSDRSPGI